MGSVKEVEILKSSKEYDINANKKQPDKTNPVQELESDYEDDDKELEAELEKIRKGIR